MKYVLTFLASAFVMTLIVGILTVLHGEVFAAGHIAFGLIFGGLAALLHWLYDNPTDPKYKLDNHHLF